MGLSAMESYHLLLGLPRYHQRPMARLLNLIMPRVSTFSNLLLIPRKASKRQLLTAAGGFQKPRCCLRSGAECRPWRHFLIWVWKGLKLRKTQCHRMKITSPHAARILDQSKPPPKYLRESIWITMDQSKKKVAPIITKQLLELLQNKAISHISAICQAYVSDVCQDLRIFEVQVHQAPPVQCRSQPPRNACCWHSWPRRRRMETVNA